MKKRLLFACAVTVVSVVAARLYAQSTAEPLAPPAVPADTPRDRAAPSPYGAQLRLPSMNSDDPSKTYGALKAIAIREHAKAEEAQRVADALIGLNNKNAEIDGLHADLDKLRKDLAEARKRIVLQDDKTRKMAGAGLELETKHAKLKKQMEREALANSIQSVVMLMLLLVSIALIVILYRRAKRFRDHDSLHQDELDEALAESHRLEGVIARMRREAEETAARSASDFERRLEEARRELRVKADQKSGETEVSRAEPVAQQGDGGPSTDVNDAFGINPDEGAQEPPPPDIVVTAGADVERGTVAAMPAVSDGAPNAEQVLASRLNTVGPPEE